MLHELFLFIGGCMCYASCLATVGVEGFIGGAAVLARNSFEYLQSIGACGSVFKICTDLCTVSDYSDSREEDSSYPIIVSK